MRDNRNKIDRSYLRTTFSLLMFLHQTPRSKYASKPCIDTFIVSHIGKYPENQTQQLINGITALYSFTILYPETQM